MRRGEKARALLGKFRCGWVFCLALAANVSLLFAAEIRMAEVEALAKLPVSEIFKSSLVQEISRETYWKFVRGSKIPVVVMFYSNEDQDSQNLATLVRYVANDYRNRVAFYRLMVVAKGKPDRPTIAQMQRAYSLDKVPGTFFYDNDTGKMVLEREQYDLPTFKEYRTPGMFLWKVYYNRVRAYIDKNILD